MAKTRQTKVLPSRVPSTEEAEALFGEYASADAKIQKMTSQMDIEITRIREKYAQDLQKLEELRTEKFEALQHFAVNTPDLFTKKKSFEFSHGILGFRTGTPKLKLIKGFTWAKVLDNLKHYLSEYVRTTEEPAKDRLLADREITEVKDNMGKCGITFDQDETFFIEPKKEQSAAA